MGRFFLFYRLMLRPLLHEPVRVMLTILAVTLGVAVVLAIDLAGGAAAGSFRASMETLAGDNDLEIVASGGVPETVVGTIATLPYSIRISPRIEDSAFITDRKQTIPLIGLDLVAESGSVRSGAISGTSLGEASASSENAALSLQDSSSIWVGASLGKKPGDQLRLLINDQVREFTVRGVYPDSNGSELAIVMDLAAAQRALNRFGRVNRILLKVPEAPSLEEWQQRIRAALPAGVEVRTQGTGINENRRMLSAFRWNLRLLSYIALIVGAFLIYNTISVSVVRRRPETGIVRALGASRGAVLGAFIGEAAFFGLAGAGLGLPVGRVMASGAVNLMAATVESLYVSSRPGSIELSIWSVVLAFVVGVGVAIVSAYPPAREASLVSPVEAMARGRREYAARVHKTRDLWMALALGCAAAAAAQAPAVAGKPFFGYLAAILLICASALAMPAFVSAATSLISFFIGRTFGVEVLLATRSLAGSLRRTSVLVGALATAIAVLTAVGIMVGSFRETVTLWMDDILQADLFLSPAVPAGADRHPTMSAEIPAQLAQLPQVEAVDQLRTYEIRYQGLPATIGGMDARVRGRGRRSLLSGAAAEGVFRQLIGKDAVIISEPFANKHRIRAGDILKFGLGGKLGSFRVLDIYYDYSSEGGVILMDRATLFKYLRDTEPSNVAVYLKPGVSLEQGQRAVERVIA